MKQAGNNYNTVDLKNVIIADKLLEYECKSTKQPSFLKIEF